MKNIGNSISICLWSFAFIFLADSALYGQLASCTGNDIGGTVFREFSADGMQDAGELGIEGVTVNAYTGSGLASTTTTLSDGSYSLNSLVAGITYRIEFVWSENYLEPSPVGTNSNTSVQFILAGTCNVDFGLHNPGDFCDDNPRLYTACYQDFEYNGPNASKDALVSWEYNEGGGNNPTTKVIEGIQSDVGSVWGLAYHRSSKNFLWASFMKRHVGFGPDGIGAIYKKDVTSGAISLWADFESILGAGTLGANPHPAGTAMDCDPNSWDPVGKRSFGDVEMSDDQSTLYTINLNTRELYKIDITDFPATPVAGDITAISIPILGTAGGAHVDGVSDPAPSTNMRPFGLGFHDGLLYVGVVYTAESSQSAADMYGYVYSFDPSNNTFNTTAVISFPLNYPRGCAVNLCSTYGSDADWNPWVTTWTIKNSRFSREKVYPQAWISDIEFSDDGYMILGLRDRFGDQTGYRQKSTSCTGLYHGDVAGDLLMASPNGNNTWTMESGGNVGTKSASGSQGSTQGPGNGEFFWRDYFFDTYFNQVLHEETSLGSVIVVPGKNEVVSTNYDVSRDFQGGIAYFSTDDGSRTRFVQVFRSTTASNSTFGKGGGLGDIEAACLPAPIEIGNFVWEDADKDGIQDPEEMAFNGVNVNLYVEDSGSPGTYILVGKSTTDANGNYIFNESNVDMSGVSPINGNPNSGTYTGLDPFTTYYISIDDSSQFNTGTMFLSISGKDYFLTTQDANSNNSDKIDSDAALNATAGAPFNGYPTIVANVGGAGKNDHGFDFGFYEATCDVLVGLSATQSSICSDDESVDFTVTYQTGASGDFRLVYSTSTLTVAQLYALNGTVINANVTTTPSQNYTLESNFSFPQNTTGSAITYYVYAILEASHPDLIASVCEPVVETTVTVQPETATATFSSTSQTICGTDNGGMENVIDLSSLISSGSTGGIWTDTDGSGGLSGSTFTANAGMEGNLYTFTYTLSGLGSSSTCDDNVYQVFIEVVNCPCNTNAITLCAGETYTATATTGTSNYQWYLNGSMLMGETNSTYTITGVGEYYYTATDATGCDIELTCRINVTSGNPTATLSSNTVSICNVDLGGSDNVFDLSTLVVLGEMGGTWIDTDATGSLSGSTFTATSGQAGNSYTVTYRVSGTPPCSDVDYPVTVTVNNCSCPTLNSISSPGTICQADIFSLTTSHSSAPGDLAIYYNSGAALTATDLYSMGNGGAALLTTITSPAGTSSSSHGNSLPAGTYNIYLILNTTNPEYNPPSCQPMVSTTLTIQDLTETVTIDNPPTICNVNLGASDNQLDLNSLISAGPTSGSWNDDDATGGLSGSTFTASTAGSFDFTYTVSGPAGAGSGACNDQTYTITVEVQDCSCPILTLSGAPAQVCSDDNFSIDFNHSSNPGDLNLFYILDDGMGLTATQLYNYGGGNGGATQIGGTISPAMNANTTNLSISLPQNTTGANVSYLIYGILANGNGFYSAGVCEPVALTSVLVKPETATATVTTSATICEADFGGSENVINLNTLITAGDMTGSWSDDDMSGGLIGSFFTATNAMAGNMYDFTYTVSGADGAGGGACHDNTYTVTITVNTCTVPCPQVTSVVAPLTVCSDESFDITINYESGIGNLGIFYAEDLGLTPSDFYATMGMLNALDADFTTSGTSQMKTIMLPANTDTVSKKIYLFVGLASGNASFSDPFCMPFSTYIISQEPATTITATPTDPTTCSGTDGSILLQTLAADSTYAVSYSDDGMSVGPTNYTADGSGDLTISGLNAGSYTNITVTKNGCTGAAVSATLSDPPNPTCSITGSTTVVENTQDQMYSGPGGMTSYAWSVTAGDAMIDGSSTGQNVTIDFGTVNSTLELTITDANGCSATCSINITMTSSLVCAISGPSSTCASTTGLTFTGVAGASTYSWNITSGDAMINGASNAQMVTVDAGSTDFTIELTISPGLTPTCSEVVTVNALPTPSLSNVSVCPGATTTLDPGMFTSYLWSTTATTQTITAGMGTYTVTVTDSNGCTATASATISEHAAPTPSLSDVSVCPGATTTLDPGMYTSYLWSTTATTQTITVGMGTYTVTVTDSNGCTATASATISEHSAPTPSLSDVTVCPGATSTLDPGMYTSYSWSNSATTQTIIVGAGTYTVTVMDSNGCTATASATISEHSAPTPSLSNVTVCPGATSTLDPGMYTSYLWSNTATTQTITVGMGTYTVTVTDSNGCTATASATISEHSAPTPSLSDVTVCPGATSTLDPGMYTSYSWSNSATTQTIIVGAGTYTVTVTDSNGCTATASATISEHSAPTPSLSDISVCPGGTTTLDPGMYTSYLWSTTATTQTITAGMGTYTVTVTDSNGCTATASATISEHSAPTPSLSDISVCPGATTTLDPGMYTSYLWSTTATTQTITVGMGTYTVTVTDSNGCTATASATISEHSAPTPSLSDVTVCPGATSTLDPGMYTSYLWSTTATTQTITVGMGTYTVTVTDSNGCTATASATISEHSAPTPSLSNVTVCPGATSTLDPGMYTSYLWSNTATTRTITVGMGTYTVTVTDSNGCTATASATISEHSAPTPSLSDLSVCPGGTTTLDPGMYTSYLWSNTATTQTITVGMGTYTVTVTDSNGCTATASATVSEHAAPTPSLSDITVCPGATTTLDPGMYSSYLWSTTATTQTITVGMGTYTVTVTDSNGCTATASATISEHTAPTCSILGLTTVTESTTGNTYNGPAGMSTYSWSISGNGTINGAINTQSVSIDAGAVGSYTLTLNITDSNGCPATCMQMVTVESAKVADLSLTKIVDNSVADIGQTVVFTLVIQNDGPDDATGVQVTDQLPSGFMYQSDDGMGSYMSNIWTVGNLANGESDTLNITATVLAAGVYQNDAYISAMNENDSDSDPDFDNTVDDLTDGLPDDDEDSATVTPNLNFDLSLDKHLAAGQNTSVDLGDDISYMIVVTNEGDVTASNIEICDLIPAGLILSPNDTSSWSGTTADTVYHTIPGPISPGQSDSVNIILRVAYGAAGSSLINTAEIFDDTDNDGNGVIDSDSSPANGVSGEDDIEEEGVTLLDHDPTGYIYCEKTGLVVSGGTISITGPSGIPDDPTEVAIVQDGSTGYYEWYAIGPIGTYTMTYSHPNGHAISSVKTVTAPLYNVPTGPPNITLGSDTTGMYLADTTFANNPYYLSFAIEPGDAFVFLNNIPVTCVFLGSVVCEDDDLNETDDGNEPAFPNVIVRLYNCADTINPIDTMLTDTNGNYRFDGLPAGDYRVQFVEPAGYRIILTQADTISADGFTSCTSLLLGECDTTKTVCFRTIPYDWGDLPDGSVITQAGDYQTTSSNNGPSHEIITGLMIGATVDEETDGQQSTLADGDGIDEDGFLFPMDLHIRPGITLSRPLVITNTTGTTAHFEAWIDWNGDGDFDDANEMIADLSDDGAGDFGVSSLTINVPSDATQNQALGVRFRLSHTDGMTPYGQVDSGEVEDYLIAIGCPLSQCLPATINVIRP